MTAATPDRLEKARASLMRHGLSGCEATAEGGRGEVLVLRPATDEEEALLREAGVDELIAELKKVGFGYVALDLAPRGESG